MHPQFQLVSSIVLAAAIGCADASNGGLGGGDMGSGTNSDLGAEPDLGVDVRPQDLGPTDMRVEPMLVALTARPASASLEVGQTVQVTVEGRLDDESLVDVTDEVIFSSSDIDVAEVDARGLVTAVGPGSTTIAARLQGLVASLDVAVEMEETAFYLYRDGFQNGVTTRIAVLQDMNGMTGPTVTVASNSENPFAGSEALDVEVVRQAQFNFIPTLWFDLPGPTDLSAFDAFEFHTQAEQRPVGIILAIELSDGSTIQTFRAVTGDWGRFVLPLPNPSKFTNVRSLRFEFIETDRFFRIDELRFIEHFALPEPEFELFVDAVGPGSGPVGLPIGGQEFLSGLASYQTADAAISPSVFLGLSFSDSIRSTMPTVATIDAQGFVRGVSEGTAEIVAEFDGVSSTPLEVEVFGAAQVPSVPAPVPTYAAADVFALYSNAYPTIASSSADSPFDVATPSEITVMGDDVFVATFAPNSITPVLELLYEGMSSFDLSDFQTVRFDVWAGPHQELVFLVVDAGPDGILNRGPNQDDVVGAFFAGPGMLRPNQWVSFEFPLADLMMAKQDDVQVLVFGTDSSDPLYFDNILFVK